MIHVYVWNSGWQGGIGGGYNWGHAAMWIQRETTPRSRYVSWWPRAGAGFAFFNLQQGGRNTIASDVASERIVPHHIFVFRDGPGQLVESAMVAEWDRIKTQMVYSATDTNCAKLVAHLLKAGGAPYAPEVDFYRDRGIWFPSAIVEWCEQLTRSLRVARAPRPWPAPPPDTPR